MASDLLQYLKKKKLRLYILAGIFLFYHLLFNSFTGQILLNKILASAIATPAKVQVQGFSPLFGIKLSDLEVYPSPEWGSEPFFRLKELQLSYNLPLLFLGRAKISKIGVHGLHLDLKQKGETWNFSSIFLPGKKEPEPPVPEKEPRTSIRTYFPFSAYLMLDCKDINVSVDSENGPKSYKAALKGLELGLEVDTNRFTRIPLDLSAIDLIDEFSLQLNPKNEVTIQFQNASASLDHSFRLTWIWERHPQDQDVFHSKMDLGSERIPIQFRNRTASPFAFSVKYDLDLSAKKKELLLRDLAWKVGEDIWLEGGGKVSDIREKSAQVNLAIQKSRIRLSPFSDFLHSLGFYDISLAGEASLAPVLAEGSWENLKILGEVKGNGLEIRLGKKKHSIPTLYLDWSIGLRPGSQEEPNSARPLPWLDSAICKNFKVEYNGMRLGGDLHYNRSSGPSLDLNLENFSLGDYLAGYSGRFFARLQAKGPDFSKLNADLKLKANGFKFPLARGNSGNIGLDGSLSSILYFPKKPWGLTDIFVSVLDLEADSPDGQAGARLNSSGRIGLGDNFVLDLKKTRLDVDLENLIPLLPLSLRETLIPVRAQVGNGIGLLGDFYFSSNSHGQEIRGGLGLDLPGLDLRDGKLSLAMQMLGKPSSQIKIENLELNGFAGKLSFRTSGVLAKPGKGDPPPSMGEFSPDLKGGLRIVAKENSSLIRGLHFRGDMGLNFTWLGSVIQGNLISKDSNILVQNSHCPGYDCKMYRIDGWNSNVPFTHDLSVKETKNLIEGNKRKFVMNYGRTPAPNFTIQQILGAHPSLKGVPFEYVKPKSNSPGLSANLEYSENYLRMDYLKVNTLDGEIWGKDMIVNVGSGDPEKMEYSVSLRVKDIDLKQLLPAKSQSKIDDGKVKADLNLWGRNLGDPVPNLNLFFSVYQIGNDFGKSAINIFAPSNLFTDFIYGSYAVDKIELELSKGLVYAVILFKRSILGTFINLENNQVSQQRMPLANFLKRAQSEIETFNQ
ncbi:hypothetical protein EHQ53_04205 [Leptospira langatensis]|uniref:AsmA family protein n=1 Tax=Leptospira langatensis TaxID=2484983 RepID=A0A5F1ZXE3_9LEPT|nr:hypothetical protein [Leptospira langatensis]TGK00028.1 hypothetical protein EHO57_12070 [Leptospira langatensis]TGL42663.1 hypothetical protein EHQ53_04205 [Leptospira langatensis]